MLIKMNKRSSRAELSAAQAWLARNGADARVIGDSIVVLKGDAQAIEQVKHLPGVASVEPLRTSHKLVARQTQPGGARVQVGDLLIGGNEFAVIAGPCAVESEAQIIESALAVARAGARILRGGAYKPRTSPYSFQGLGAEGLPLLAKAGREAGLPTITEVVAPNDVSLVAEHVDVLQVGARNAQNYEMLKALGRAARPVLLKRGVAETIEELMFAAEYIIYYGNPNVMICERGVRTFETATRNTLDLGAAALLKHLTHLPVIVDPSHGTGRRELIAPLTMAAAAVGADGVMIEVHPQPDRALSDGPQSLTPAQFTRLMRELSALLPALSRSLAAPAPQLAREWMASCDEAIERLQTARNQFSRRIARSAAA